MSGQRSKAFWKGDQSEDTAKALLKYIGQAISVERQQDIGYDFLCSVAKEEKEGVLSFHDQFLVSVKSLSKSSIELAPPKNWDGGFPHHIDWMFGLDLPLILAVVDKKKGTMALYSTTAAWWVLFNDYHEAGAISLVPRIKGNDNSMVSPPRLKGMLEKFPKRHYVADLGNPFFVMSHQDAHDEERLKIVRRRLEYTVNAARANIRFARAGVPYFFWFSLTPVDFKDYGFSFHMKDLPVDALAFKLMMKDVAPMLAAYAMRLKSEKNRMLLDSVGEVLRLAPEGCVPRRVMKHLYEIYGHIEGPDDDVELEDPVTKHGS